MLIHALAIIFRSIVTCFPPKKAYKKHNLTLKSKELITLNFSISKFHAILKLLFILL